MCMDEKEVQNKIVMFQLLQQHVEQLRQQAQILERQALEAELTSQALENFTQLKEDTEILLPFGSGMYAPGKSAKVETVLTDVGSNIVVKKSVEDSKKTIDKRKKELEDTGKKMQDDLQETLLKIQMIAAEIQEYQEQMQGKQNQGLAE